MPLAKAKLFRHCGQCDEDLSKLVGRACQEAVSHTAYIKVMRGVDSNNADLRLHRMVWVECTKGHTTGFTCPEGERDRNE